MTSKNKELEWINPAEREENSHLDFRKVDTIYLAENLGTILDVDSSFKYLEKEYRVKHPRPWVRIWSLNRTTGIRTLIDSK